MIQLCKMSAEAYLSFKTCSITDYAEDLAKGKGLRREEALAAAERDFDQQLPLGPDTPDQFLMTITDPSNASEVGWIWFSYESENDIRQVWLNDFLIYEPARRKGYATAALAEMERMAKNDGCAVCSLFVWDHNPAGYALYERCGYRAEQRLPGGSVLKKGLGPSRVPDPSSVRR